MLNKAGEALAHAKYTNKVPKSDLIRFDPNRFKRIKPNPIELTPSNTKANQADTRQILDHSCESVSDRIDSECCEDAKDLVSENIPT